MLQHVRTAEFFQQLPRRGFVRPEKRCDGTDSDVRAGRQAE